MAAGVFLPTPPPLWPPFETSSSTTAAAAVSAVLALLTRQTSRLSALPAGRRLPPRRLPPRRPLPTAGDAEEGGFDRPHFHRMPTPPWMTTPLLLPPEQALDLSNPDRSNKEPPDTGEPDGSLTGKVRGGRGRKAMRLIVRSVNKLQRLRQPDDPAPACPSPSSQDESPIGALEGLFEASRVDRCEKSSGKKVPWARAEKKLGFPRLKKEKATTAAEMILDPAFLVRLRGEAAAMRKWVTVKKAGVTDCKVEEIRRFWREGELAMVRFDEPLCRNMERALEIVEVSFLLLFFFFFYFNYLADQCL